MEEQNKDISAFSQLLGLEAQDEGNIDFSNMEDSKETIDTKTDSEEINTDKFKEFTTKLFKLFQNMK